MSVRGLVLSLAVFVFSCVARAQSGASGPIEIDATAAVGAPGPANYTFAAEEARSPSGHVLGVNARYLTLDGKPWIPVMGEMHYTRVPEAEWEEEILKMKSAGVQVVATYLIWIHHEEVQGEWEWTGNKDLRRFVQLCQKHGLYVVPRVGPWSHAEVRNGGFPDWVVSKVGSKVRSNDPEYLQDVDAYYKQIGEQLKGLMWSEGGPVVAIQLENEYSRRGPGRGTEHILKLKEMARADGLRVPFYTETAWDNAAIPTGAVLPVSGGYPDAPWDASIGKLKASEVYAFRFHSRLTGDMGAQNGTAPASMNSANSTGDTPFMTAEMGGGMQVTYHRRPVVSADDIAAMMPVMLGSGVNLYGSYMFHGGENPDGKLSTLQESVAREHYNDLPVKTYDFEAPIGEFGDERESLRKLKSWDYFLNDFGGELAPMEPRRPSVVPAGPADFSVARVSARTAGGSGFLFVNNHVRGYSMPARPAFQVEVKLPGGKALRVPEKPVDVPADAYFMWPFGMDMGGVTLRYATAQPLAKLGTEAAPVYAFFAQPGIAPEFVVEKTPGLRYEVSAGSAGGVETSDGAVVFGGVNAGERGGTIRFTLQGGRQVTVLLLSQETAEQAWKVSVGSVTALVASPQQAFVDGPVVTLDNPGAKTFAASVIPRDALRLEAEDSKLKLGHAGADVSWSVPGGAAVQAVAVKQTKQGGEVAPLPAGFQPSGKPRAVASAPTEEDWARAGVWTLTLPAGAMAPSAGTREFLRIRYTGDVARLSAGGKLLDDDFADGRPWLVGLTRFAPAVAGRPLELAVYPLRKNPPMFFEPGLEPRVDGTQVDRVDGVELVTEYRLRLRAVAAR